MMTLELLTEFSHQELRRNKNIVVEKWRVSETRLHLSFFDNRDSRSGFGTLVDTSRYQNWLIDRRQDRIDQILW